MQAIAESLKNKPILVNGQIVKILELIDCIAPERSVGIPNGFVVVLGEDAQEYVIFDNGEIQNSEGTVVGQTSLLEDCRLL